MIPDDDERTVVRPSSGQRTGDGAAVPGHVLPVGTRLREYEITGLIGEGGFGIVYLAEDVSLQRRVAIKEYMPSSMASRVGGSATIVVKSERHRETFAAGLKSFVNEARLLARFDHPALVKVYRFWEENGTAYMAMPYYQGPTLKSALAARREPPDEAALRQLLAPLLDALSVMHAAQCYHRDIAPDNILLTATGPLLLDFGAARRVIGDMTHALTVVLKPGYAPIEQYGDVATMAQGAWTDLYALACVLYFAITGKVPMSSVERLMDDRLEPLSRISAGRYSARFLQAIDAALAVRPQDRPQTDAAFRALLGEPVATATGDDRAPLEPVLPTARVPSTSLPAAALAPPSAHGPVTGGPPPPGIPPPATPDAEATVVAPTRPPVSASTPTPVSAHAGPRSMPVPLLVAGGVAVVAAIAVGIVQFSSPARRTDGETGQASAPATATGGGASPAMGPAPIGPGATPASTSSPPTVGPSSISASDSTVGSAPTVGAPSAVVPDADARTPVARPPTATPSTRSNSATAATTAPVQPVRGRGERAAADEPRNESAGTAGARAGSPGHESPRDETPRYETPRYDNRSREAARPDAAHTDAPVVKPATTPGVQAKCSDILQKASLEPLTADEAAFLRRECR